MTSPTKKIEAALQRLLHEHSQRRSHCDRDQRAGALGPGRIRPAANSCSGTPWTNGRNGPYCPRLLTARFAGWRLLELGAAKLKRLDEILGELVRVDAGHPDIVQGYADLYFADQQGGHNTGESDLWIAATAKVTGAVLLTADSDFGWLHPGLIRVELVPEYGS